MSDFRVTCYGSRGSLPAPSRKDFSTVKYGGNTNCFLVEAGPFKLILDAGTGISVLSEKLMADWAAAGMVGQDFILWLSHFHSDHCQGLPFCVPIFIKANRWFIHGFKPAGYEGPEHLRTVVEQMLAHQQSPPHFPIAHESLPAYRDYESHDRQFSTVRYYRYGYYDTEYGGICSDDEMRVRPCDEQDYEFTPAQNRLKLTTIPLNHPDGSVGVRIDYLDKSVCYCCDNEPLRYTNAAINKIAKDTDLIILDGAYTEEQIKSNTQTFGHGSAQSCVEQARACGAKLLWVTHHDPKADDVSLDKTAQYLSTQCTSDFEAFLAAEGRCIQISYT